MPYYFWRSARRFASAAPVALCLLGMLFGPVVQAQEAPQPTDDPAPRTRPDFLFGRPHGSAAIRGAWLFARGGSDLFDFVERQLTIDKGDFHAPALSAELAVALTGRLDVLFGYEYAKSAISSEYRDYVDNNRLPIEQKTRLSTTNLSGTVRYALTPHGRPVSRLAWVPSRWVPFVGAGAGAMRYSFEQTGDFVDFEDLKVFGDRFASEGWTPSVHVLGGLDVHLYRPLYASIEGRYVWADAKLSDDFIGFEPIDLSGFRIAAGLNVLF